jgi:SAM-dependent methyltransferase
VEHCRQRFPGADVRVGDLADLKATVEGPFDAIVMTDNLIDVLDDKQRRVVLADLRELLSPDGRLVFSSHNLDGWDHRPAGRGSPTTILREAARRSPASWVRMAIDFPVVRRNRRRLGPLQYREGDHAVINDAAHQYGLLHYYIGRLDQERQLTELGFRVLEVLEVDGSTVAPGEAGQSSSLYYVAAADPASVP